MKDPIKSPMRTSQMQMPRTAGSDSRMPEASSYPEVTSGGRRTGMTPFEFKHLNQSAGGRKR